MQQDPRLGKSNLIYFLDVSNGKNEITTFNFLTKKQDIFSNFESPKCFRILAKNNSALSCDITGKCSMMDLDTKLKIKEVKFSIVADVLLDYSSTFLATEGENLVIGMASLSSPPILEILDHSKETPKTNIALSLPYLDSPLLIQGVYGTSFCLLKYGPQKIYLVNPYSQKESGSLNILDTIDFYSPSKQRVLNFGISQTKGETYFHAFTAKSELGINHAWLSRISICGGIGCNKCNSDLTDCLYCEEGVPKFRDKDKKDYVCLKTCPDPLINQVSIPNERCINCVTEYYMDKVACNSTLRYSLAQVPLAQRAKNYSISLKLVFPEVRNTTRLSKIFHRVMKFNPDPQFTKRTLNVKKL